MRVAVFGLGKLGSPLLALLADAGHDVVGCDVMPQSASLLNRGQAPVVETDLQLTLDRARGHYSATTDPATATEGAEIIFIVVPTPSLADHTFSTLYTTETARMIGSVMANQPAPNGYRLIVMVSTLMPEAMQAVFIPALEKWSRQTCNVEFGVAYNPEFIALGSVLHNLRYPDFVLIGQSDEKAGRTLEGFYCDLYENRLNLTCPPMRRMSLVNAEITKLSINAYLTMKIGYGNQLAGLCERLPNADAVVVAEAVGCDSRIGPKCLRPATMHGGPCLPRDTRALVALGTRLNVEVPLAHAAESINREWIERTTHLIERLKPKKIAVLGLTYKPHTHVVEDAAGIHLLRSLGHRLANVERHAYDPSADHGEVVIALRSYNVAIDDSVEVCVDGCDVIVITTPWPQFAELAFRQFATIIDCWRILDPAKQGLGIKLIYQGRGETCPN